jgi:Tfp pilus assembly protein PilO
MAIIKSSSSKTTIIVILIVMMIMMMVIQFSSLIKVLATTTELSQTATKVHNEYRRKNNSLTTIKQSKCILMYTISSIATHG